MSPRDQARPCWARGRPSNRRDASLAPTSRRRCSRQHGPGAEAFQPVATDGQALAFRDGSFDAVVCQLGLQFFPEPARGLTEFRRVLRAGRCAAVCVVSTPDRAPMWGVLADTLSRHLPEQRAALHLGFALAETERLAHLFSMTGFRDVRVQRETRQGTIASF